MKKITLLSFFMLGMVFGVLFQKYIGLWKVKMVIDDLAPISWKREVIPFDALPEERLMVALVFGQSNSANFGQGRIQAREGVFNFYQGVLYRAEDPMLGADGSGVSVWPRLGNLLIASKRYDTVVFASIGISASQISRWQPSGDLHPSILSTLQSLKSSGLEITHLLWHQGESDAIRSTSGEQYQLSFKRMLKSIREQGVNAPVYVSIATRYRDHPENLTIRKAQIELTNASSTILPGPDSDGLGGAYRRDGTHFSSAGLDRFAQLWFDSLVKGQKR